MRKLTPKQAEERITAWLKEEGIFSLKKNYDDFYFYIQAVCPESSGKFYEIFQSKEQKDVVVVGLQVVMGEAVKRAYRMLSERKKEEFVQDFKLALLQKDVAYEVNYGEGIEGVTINELIYYDGLTRDRLMQVIHRIYNTILLINMKLTQHLNIKELVDVEQSPMYH